MKTTRSIRTMYSLAICALLGAAVWGASLASNACGANLITLASFNDANGSGPYAGLSVGPSGKLYGTTLYGGAHGYGALFQVDPATGELNTLLSLNGNMDGTTGSRPYGGVIAAADGNLYGTMYIGGAVASGTVFKFQVEAGAFTTLASFQRRNGGGPVTDLIFDADGKLYGTTGDGGIRGYGTVFEFDPASGSLDALVSFDHDTNGGRPYGRLVFDVDGNLYGTTYQGGPERYGTIFKIDHDTGFFTTLATFNGANGRGSHSGLTIDTAGNLYGTTQQGGANDLGTIFKLDRSTGVLTTLLSFNGANGSYPEAGMIADAAGNLYGTTREGGASNFGTIFMIDSRTAALTTLVTFNLANGAHPCAELIADADGNLYGTTFGINTAGDTVFKLTDTGFVVPSVPEPASLSLLLLGTVAMVCRRRACRP